jgi:hypothetical protein
MQEIEQPTTQKNTSAPEQEVPTDLQRTGQGQGHSIGRTLAIIGIVLIVVLVVASVLYGLVSHPPFTAVLRDISIIVLAMVTAITSILLAVLLFQLQSLIVLLRDEVQPILESINETTGTVRGTTTFVSDAVVTPLIQVSSYASAVRQTLRLILGGSKKRGNPPPGSGQA